MSRQERQEDFDVAAKKVASTKRTADAQAQCEYDFALGAEYGYQYAIEKIFKCIEDQAIFGWIEDIEVDKFLEEIRKTMQ